MSKKETNKYFIPVELTRFTPNKWIGIKTYEYRLYSDTSEQKFSRIKFIDFNGFIIGEHMPTKLHSVYDKAALKAKSATVKAVSEIKNVVDGVADIAVATASEMHSDFNYTAKHTVNIATGIFGKIKTIAKNRMKKIENSELKSDTERSSDR